MNAPANAPMIGPTIGTGTPTIAPTVPPMIAPQLARREPPYLRAYLPASVNSKISPTTARTVVPTSVIAPMLLGTRIEYPTPAAIITHVPGSPSGIMNSDRRQTAARSRTSTSASLSSREPLQP